MKGIVLLVLGFGGLLLSNKTNACVVNDSVFLTPRCPCPQVSVTCNGKTGYVQANDIPKESQKLGAKFTPKEDLDIYENKESLFSDRNKIIYTNPKNVGDGTSSDEQNAELKCKYIRNPVIIDANVPKDKSSCNVKICYAYVECSKNGKNRMGNLTCPANIDGTCPDFEQCSKDNNFSLKEINYDDPLLPKVLEAKSEMCAYKRIDILKGTSTQCGDFSFCFPAFRCNRKTKDTDGKDKIVTLAGDGACLRDLKNINSPTAGCPTSAESCSNDESIKISKTKIGNLTNEPTNNKSSSKGK